MKRPYTPGWILEPWQVCSIGVWRISSGQHNTRLRRAARCTQNSAIKVVAEAVVCVETGRVGLLVTNDIIIDGWWVSTRRRPRPGPVDLDQAYLWMQAFWDQYPKGRIIHSAVLTRLRDSLDK